MKVVLDLFLTLTIRKTSISWITFSGYLARRPRRISTASSTTRFGVSRFGKTGFRQYVMSFGTLPKKDWSKDYQIWFTWWPCATLTPRSGCDLGSKRSKVKVTVLENCWERVELSYCQSDLCRIISSYLLLVENNNRTTMLFSVWRNLDKYNSGTCLMASIPSQPSKAGTRLSIDAASRNDGRLWWCQLALTTCKSWVKLGALT